MSSASRYAEVAVRLAWSDLLRRLGLHAKAGQVYDEALLRAADLADVFEPVNVTQPVNWALGSVTNTARGASTTYWLTFPKGGTS